MDTLRAAQRLGRCGAARAGQTRGRALAGVLPLVQEHATYPRGSGRFGDMVRRGAEIMSRFILACILAPAAQHCSVSSTHCLQNVAA